MLTMHTAKIKKLTMHTATIKKLTMYMFIQSLFDICQKKIHFIKNHFEFLSWVNIQFCTVDTTTQNTNLVSTRYTINVSWTFIDVTTLFSGSATEISIHCSRFF